MNLGSVIAGVLVLLYGLFILITRFTDPEKHTRLVLLKNKLGNGLGTLIHTIVYVIAPFILAAYLIIHGMAGESLSQIFTPPAPPPE